MHNRRLGWLILLLAWPVLAMARVTIDPTTASTTVNWTGGDVVYDVPFCVQSTQEPNVNQGATLIPYDVTVSIGGTTQPYALWVGGAGPGLPVTAQWTDLQTGSVYVFSPPGVITTPRELSGVTDCPAPANARLRLQVAQADIANAAGGSYTRAFTVTVTNAGAPGGRRSHSATVSLTINVPLIARISQLNDISLGVWMGGDLIGTDSLCVYRNGPGLYTVTTTGDDVGGAYAVSNGPVRVPYTVDWNDGTGFAPMTSGVPLTNRANAWMAGDGCNGGASNNAAVRVTVTEAALGAAAVTGAYSGVLTILYSTQ